MKRHNYQVSIDVRYVLNWEKLYGKLLESSKTLEFKIAFLSYYL